MNSSPRLESARGKPFGTFDRRGNCGCGNPQVRWLLKGWQNRGHCQGRARFQSQLDRVVGMVVVAAVAARTIVQQAATERRFNSRLYSAVEWLPRLMAHHMCRVRRDVHVCPSPLQRQQHEENEEKAMHGFRRYVSRWCAAQNPQTPAHAVRTPGSCRIHSPRHGGARGRPGSRCGCAR